MTDSSSTLFFRNVVFFKSWYAIILNGKIKHEIMYHQTGRLGACGLNRDSYPAQLPQRIKKCHFGLNLFSFLPPDTPSCWKKNDLHLFSLWNSDLIRSTCPSVAPSDGSLMFHLNIYPMIIEEVKECEIARLFEGVVGAVAWGTVGGRIWRSCIDVWELFLRGHQKAILGPTQTSVR